MTTPPPGSTPKIEFKNVHKSFGDKHVLRGLDLTVGKGESVVIIGGSGTGKSVTLKCALSLLKPDQGSIKIDDAETVGIKGSAKDKHLDRFGMLFQGSALFDSREVWRNVAFKLIQAMGVPRKEAKERALAVMAQVGLSPQVGELFPAELSGGMQKRVALARAIAAKPEIIFFDEPTTGLDPIMADVINELIVKCVRELGASTLTITHDMASARKIADRIAMLHEGRIIWVGDKRDIDHSGNPYVDQFIHGRADGPIKMQVKKG